MKKRILTTALLLFTLLAVLSVSTFAWLSSVLRQEVTVSGSLLTGYFDASSGDGRAPGVGRAYRLSNATHVYNLAWLQYLGYFNETETVDGKEVAVTYYFEVMNDIDMGGIIIPPIGTEENPFVGNFNGQGCKISNFTVSNYLGTNGKGIIKKPMQVSALDTERSIVGFFGVVGNYPGAFADGVSFDAVNASKVANLLLDHFTVRTETKSSLIGLLAGYVNGAVEQVGVGNSSIEIGSGVKPLVTAEEIESLVGVLDRDLTADEATAIQQAVSLYSLIGLYNAAYVTWEQLPGGGIGAGIVGEDGSGFGESMDMVELITRLTYMYSANRMSGQSYDLKVWSTSAYDSYKTNYKLAHTTYLGKDAIVPLNIDIGETFYVKDSDTKYQESDGSYTESADGDYIQVTQGNNTFYVQIDVDAGYFVKDENGQFIKVESGDTTSSDTIGYYKILEKNYGSSTSNPYYGNDWYASNSEEIVLGTNTGYIIGGGGYNTTGTLNASSAWVRVRNIPLNTTSTNLGIYKSLATDASDATSITRDNLQLLTIQQDGDTYKTVRIVEYQADATTHQYLKDADGKYIPLNKSESTIGNKYTSADGETMDATDLARYELVVSNFVNTDFATTSSGQTLLTGLRFFASSSTLANPRGITIENNQITSGIVTTDASIGGSVKTGYEMVEGAINFELQSAGYITTIVGAYSTGASTHSLFTLIQLTRDDNHKITKAEVIDSIWVLKKADGTLAGIEYNLTNASYNGQTYTCVYDKSNMSLTEVQAAYYFELPVKAGEYAMGALLGDDSGGYLLYLDIGADGNLIQDPDEGSTTTPTDKRAIDGVNYIVSSEIGKGTYYKDGTAPGSASSEIAIPDSYLMATYSLSAPAAGAATAAEAGVTFIRESETSMKYGTNSTWDASGLGVTPNLASGMTATRDNGISLAMLRTVVLAPITLRREE